jgi:hypothetical protein
MLRACSQDHLSGVFETMHPALSTGAVLPVPGRFEGKTGLQVQSTKHVPWHMDVVPTALLC